MKRFNVTVNGVSYDVTVEEIGATASAAQPAQAPTAQSAAPARTVAPKPAANAGSVTVKAPMPGTILKTNVSVGAAVKKGDVLCILEAMKMENDICAPQDGTVASVNVQKGSSVNTDDVLVTLG